MIDLVLKTLLNRVNTNNENGWKVIDADNVNLNNLAKELTEQLTTTVVNHKSKLLIAYEKQLYSFDEWVLVEKQKKMINTLEELIQDYARYSFMEGTIDENTSMHLVEDAQNYIKALGKENLLIISNVSKSFYCYKEEIKGYRCESCCSTEGKCFWNK